jgi:hypothetical protein
MARAWQEPVRLIAIAILAVAYTYIFILRERRRCAAPPRSCTGYERRTRPPVAVSPARPPVARAGRLGYAAPHLDAGDQGVLAQEGHE